MPLTLRRISPALYVAMGSFWLTVALHAVEWKPLTPEDFLAKPRHDQGGGVEILLKDVTIDDTRNKQTTFRNYLRLKVFGERGVAALDKVELPDVRDWSVRNIAARVIRPDGSIVDVDPGSIYTTEVLKRGSFRVRVKAFTFPALEPGCLVEYQYEEVAKDEARGLSDLKLRFQERWPTQVVRFHVRPNAKVSREYRLKVRTHDHRWLNPEPDADGYIHFEKRDVPAIAEEPWMPPEDVVEPWILFYYASRSGSPEDFWKMLAKVTSDYAARRIKSDKTVQLTAKQLVEGVADDNERLRRLYDFCRANIANVDDGAPGLTPTGIGKTDENQTSADTLLRRAGTGFDINILFLALASASGYEAHIARAGDRSERFFDDQLPVHFTLSDFVSAVKVGDSWVFCDPGSRHLPFGMLSWRNEGQKVLICGGSDRDFFSVPEAPSAESRVVRRAKLVLDDHGTLRGFVSLEYSGHAGVDRKNGFAGESAERIAALVRDEVHERLGTAEISNVLVENAADPTAPIRITYVISVPEYAARTDRRMVFQPGIFQKGGTALFAAENRAFDLFTSYRFMEEDLVEIAVPRGFEFEEASAPISCAPTGQLRHEVAVGFRIPDRMLMYKRRYVVDTVYFKRADYPKVKLLHDRIHASDQHLLVLKRAGEKQSTASSEPAP